MLNVEHNFEVAAPIKDVWAYFANPSQVLPCLPGAELVETINESTYRGRLGLRLGPISAQYLGTAEILETNHQDYRMTVHARGDQQGVPGGAQAEIRFSLREVAPEITEVKLEADVSITGKLAQIGGGMIQSVSKFMFERFSRCVQETLESPRTETVS